VSTVAEITASVIQGSSLGPASYIVTAADLRPCADNAVSKFADHTYHIIPAANSHTRDYEVSRLKSSAANNNLQLNCDKSWEIVFQSRRLHSKAEQPVSPCPGIERVEKLTMCQSTLCFTCRPYAEVIIMAFQISHWKTFFMLRWSAGWCTVHRHGMASIWLLVTRVKLISAPCC